MAVRRDLGRSERAFTLIELLVVMIIIAILMAVAIPTFLVQKNTAQKTKVIQNMHHVIQAVEGCAATQVGSYNLCLEHAELVKMEPTLQEIGDVWGSSTRTPGEFDIDGIRNGRVVKAPNRVDDYQAYIVSTWIQDGDKRIWFNEAHLDDGDIIRACGEGMTDQAAPSGGAPSRGAPVPGSRMCKTGKW